MATISRRRYTEYERVIQQWLAGKRESGSTRLSSSRYVHHPVRRLTFEGPMLLSYGWWPIAYRDRARVFVTLRQYRQNGRASQSTNRQIGEAAVAAAHAGLQVVWTYDLEAGAASNLAEAKSKWLELVAEALRCRSRWGWEHYQERMKEVRQLARCYATVMGTRLPRWRLPQQWLVQATYLKLVHGS